MARSLAQPEDKFQRVAAIKAFEFCFELAWKYQQSWVSQDDGMAIASPRGTFREAAKHGLIDNPKAWFDFLEWRNLTVHTYNDDTAAQIYQVVKNDFVGELDKLIKAAEAG